MRIALIGDIHLFTLKVHPRRLLGKRLLGQSNLWINRQFRFNHTMLEPVINKVRALKLDLVLLSGDVTSTSLEDEFADVVKYLKPLSDEVPVLIVPGNHDRYTYRAARRKRVETLLTNLLPEKFPYYRDLTRRWHLIALDAARPQVVLSRGALGRGQLTAVRDLIGRFTAEDGLIVLCHYPVLIPPAVHSTWAHDLAEARKLRNILAGSPARIVYLHGHIHQPWYWETEDHMRQPFTSINAGSPCLTSEKYPLGQGFWQIELPEDPRHNLGLYHYVPQRPVGIQQPASKRQKRKSSTMFKMIWRRRLPEVQHQTEWSCRHVL